MKLAAAAILALLAIVYFLREASDRTAKLRREDVFLVWRPVDREYEDAVQPLDPRLVRP